MVTKKALEKRLEKYQALHTKQSFGTTSKATSNMIINYRVSEHYSAERVYLGGHWLKPMNTVSGYIRRYKTFIDERGSVHPPDTDMDPEDKRLIGWSLIAADVVCFQKILDSSPIKTMFEKLTVWDGKQYTLFIHILRNFRKIKNGLLRTEYESNRTSVPSNYLIFYILIAEKSLSDRNLNDLSIALAVELRQWPDKAEPSTFLGKIKQACRILDVDVNISLAKYRANINVYIYQEAKLAETPAFFIEETRKLLELCWTSTLEDMSYNLEPSEQINILNSVLDRLRSPKFKQVLGNDFMTQVTARLNESSIEINVTTHYTPL